METTTGNFVLTADGLTGIIKAFNTDGNEKKMTEIGKCLIPPLDYDTVCNIASGVYRLVDDENIGIVLIKDSMDGHRAAKEKLDAGKTGLEYYRIIDGNNGLVVVKRWARAGAKLREVTNGWLSPDGRLFCCPEMMHRWLADDMRSIGLVPESERDCESFLEQSGWVKIRDNEILVPRTFRFTLRQIDRLFDYFTSNKYDDVIYEKKEYAFDEFVKKMEEERAIET